MKKVRKNFEPMIAARHAQGMTQAKFAELLGISENYVYLIESGKKPPGPKILEKLERLESNPDAHINEEPAAHRPKTIAEQWAETPDEEFKRILLRCVEIEDWGGVEKMAAELHRRALIELNRELKEKLK